MDLIKYLGDSPQSRFGHTISQISKTKLVLFGGATGTTGKYSITSDVLLFDLTTKKWKKIDPSGVSPSPRAAHASVSVDPNQVFIFGGAAGGGGLASDELIMLDLKNGEENAAWTPFPVQGPTPGSRYGHTLTYSKPFLLVFGGHIGNEPVNDIWCLNIEKGGNSKWLKIETKSESPPPRVYHSASMCFAGPATGMMVIYGGRAADQSPLTDTWGFRRHRDGRWDWVKAPYKNNGVKPLGRYQHSTLFLNTLLIVVGGRRNNTNDSIPIDVYDTQTSEWYKFNSFHRFRHACWISDQSLFVYGGFTHKNPNIPTDEMLKINLLKFFQSNQTVIKLTGLVESFENNGVEEISMNNSSKNIMKDSNVMSNVIMNASFNNGSLQSKNGIIQIPPKSSSQKPISTTPLKNIRLSSQAVIAFSYGPEEDGNRLVKRLSIDKLQEESKKLGIGFKDQNQVNPPLYVERLFNLFLSQLLIPNDFSYDLRFSLKKELVLKLCDEVMKILEQEPVVLSLKAPLKIYGNINGQFGDLMKLFEHFGSPCDKLLNGDIEGFTYLFLGDYVDLGKYSIEVICLLLALKLKYPDGIYFLRGHHEDIRINKIFGFAEECVQKFNEDIEDNNSVYKTINRLFEYMPLAALVEDRIFCVHGGIGSNLKNIKDLDNIEKPIQINQTNNIYDKIICDMLYSDPVLNENELQNQPNPDRNFLYTNQNVKKFGMDKIKFFLKENKLSMIIRSHESCRGGFEKFANDSLITVFSAMDYCGKGGNAAAVLIIKKNLEIVPKVLYPGDNLCNIPRWDYVSGNDQTMIDENNEINNYGFITINNVKFNKEEIKLKKKNVTPLR